MTWFEYSVMVCGLNLFGVPGVGQELFGFVRIERVGCPLAGVKAPGLLTPEPPATRLAEALVEGIADFLAIDRVGHRLSNAGCRRWARASSRWPGSRDSPDVGRPTSWSR